MINAQDNDGRTSFHLAILHVQKFENLLPLKELYAKGALLDVKDNQGLSALDLIA
jgi:ankyrin repeat protein